MPLRKSATFYKNFSSEYPLPASLADTRTGFYLRRTKINFKNNLYMTSICHVYIVTIVS